MSLVNCVHSDSSVKWLINSNRIDEILEKINRYRSFLIEVIDNYLSWFIPLLKERKNSNDDFSSFKIKKFFFYWNINILFTYIARNKSYRLPVHSPHCFWIFDRDFATGFCFSYMTDFQPKWAMRRKTYETLTEIIAVTIIIIIAWN